MRSLVHLSEGLAGSYARLLLSAHVVLIAASCLWEQPAQLLWRDMGCRIVFFFFLQALSGEKAKDKSQGELSGVLKAMNYTSEQVFKF